ASARVATRKGRRGHPPGPESPPAGRDPRGYSLGGEELRRSSSGIGSAENPRKPKAIVQTYFLVMVGGGPLIILLLALLARYLHRDGYPGLFYWKPTRFDGDGDLEHRDVDQMLAAQNRYRRKRGAPERSLEEVTREAWANHDPHGDAP